MMPSPLDRWLEQQEIQNISNSISISSYDCCLPFLVVQISSSTSYICSYIMNNAAAAAIQGQGQTGAGNGDALDKGVAFAEKESGHPLSNSTTEKISDGIREGYEMKTGKDIPIPDKQMT